LRRGSLALFLEAGLLRLFFVFGLIRPALFADSSLVF